MRHYPRAASRSDSLQIAAEHIQNHGPISQPELARRMGISRAAVNVHISSLREVGLVATIGSNQSSRGRPSDLLAIDKKANGVAVAVLGDGHLLVGLAHFDREIVWKVRSPIGEETDNEMLIRLLHKSFDDLLNEAGARSIRLRYAVVCVAGKVDPRNGDVVASAHFPRLFDLKLEGQFRVQLGVPLVVLPDSCAVSAGAVIRCGSSVRRLNLIEWGYGVNWTCASSKDVFGMSLPDWRAIGHIKVEPFGRPCYCGENGCIESEVGGRAILKQWTEAGGAAVSMERLQSALSAGDEPISLLVENSAVRLGQYLSFVIQQSNPELVVVESFFKGDINRWRAAFMRGLRPRLHASQAAALTIEFVDSEAICRISGAASLAEKLFFHPGLIDKIRVASGYAIDGSRFAKILFKEILGSS